MGQDQKLIYTTQLIWRVNISTKYEKDPSNRREATVQTLINWWNSLISFIADNVWYMYVTQQISPKHKVKIKDESE